MWAILVALSVLKCGTQRECVGGVKQQKMLEEPMKMHQLAVNDFHTALSNVSPLPLSIYHFTFAAHSYVIYWLAVQAMAK